MENDSDLLVEKAKIVPPKEDAIEPQPEEGVESPKIIEPYERYKSICHMLKYPNVLADAVVVVGFQSLRELSFLIRPKDAGFYVFQICPYFDPTAFRWSKTLAFIQDVPRGMKRFPQEVLETGGCPPQRIIFSVSDCPPEVQRHERWSWSLVPVPKEVEEGDILPVNKDVNHATLHDKKKAGTEHIIAKGIVRFPRPEAIKTEGKRLVFWSCNQPYLTKPKGGVVNKRTIRILKWYARKVQKFDPMLVWGMGDTAYSDGTLALDFADSYYNESREWHNDYWANAEIREHYRRMFLYHWSFPSFQKVTRNYPHMLLWDDHEIRNGWGSHNNDYTHPNHFAMFKAAYDIASEFVFSTGPRVNPSAHSDAHMATVMDSVAIFGLDIRTSRNYVQSRILSVDQQTAFSKFLMETVAPNKAIKSLLISTSTPLAYIIPFTELHGSRLTTSIRSDIRDEWGTPNCNPSMEWLIRELAKLSEIRPDINLVNLAGDIHVSNAFELHPPIMKNPIYQITSSSLTNREHLIETMRRFLTNGTVTKYEDIRGVCYRLWPDSGKANFLLVEARGDTITFTLKVYGKKRYTGRNTDRVIVLRDGRMVDVVA